MIKSDLYLQVFIRTKIISMQSVLNTVLQKHRSWKGYLENRVVRNSEVRNFETKTIRFEKSIL